jgi:drug/metabolite transporter (DMT)-like permease
MDKRIKTGLIIKAFETIIWSLFPIVTIYCYKYIDPLFTGVISTLLSCVFFAIVITYHKQWGQIKTKEAIKPILFSTLFIAVLYYVFLFIGMKYTSAGNASIIFLMQTFFTFIVLNVWKKEKSTPKHIIGACLMIFGAILVIFPGEIVLNIGDLLILIAMIFPGVGNYYQKEARKHISSSTLMFYRNIIGSIVLMILAFSFESIPTLSDIQLALPFLLINGFILLGFAKILWVEIIHRLPITVTTALSGATPFFTLIFAYLLLNEIPNMWQLSALVPITIGVVFLSDINSKKVKTEE